MSTVWNRFAGSVQGRVQPAGWVPPDGNFAYVLGSDRPGITGRLREGDYAELAQSGTFADSKMRIRIRLRPPASTPDGFWWRASVRINGAETIAWDLIPGGGQRDLNDATWDVSQHPGIRSLAFHLELMADTAGAECEAELPAFYFDDITFEEQTTIFFGARYPAPNDVGIARTDPFRVTFFNPITAAGAGITAGQVQVNGQVAWTQGVGFGTGFTGAESAESTPQGQAISVIVDPLRIWGEEELVSIEIVGQATGAPDNQRDEIYTFRAARTRGPIVTLVEGIALRRLRVHFDEPVLAASALLASNYEVQRAPGVVEVAVVVTAVTQVSSTVFDLTTDIELSPGRPYFLQMRNVPDLLGNVSADSDNVVPFLAFQPPIPAGREWDLYAMLPQKNRTEDNGDLARFIAILQDIADIQIGEIDAFTDIIDPDVAPMAFVEEMLLDLGNPFGAFDLTDDEKRKLVQLLVPIYKQKGTDSGIVNTVRLLMGLEVQVLPIGYGVEIGAGRLGIDFRLGSGDLYDRLSFEVNVPIDLTGEQVMQLTTIVNYMKRQETHFVRLNQATLPPDLTGMRLGVTGELGIDWILH